MVFHNIVPSHLSTLSLQQALELTHVYLENAYRTKDPDVAMVLCRDAEIALSQAKRATKKHPANPNDTMYQSLRDGVATAYIDLGRYLDRRGYQSEATNICKKAEKWGGNAKDLGRLSQQSRPISRVIPQDDTPSAVVGSQGTSQVHSSSPAKPKQRPMVAVVAAHIFQENVRPPAIQHKLPQPDERLSTTPQLVCCLGLLRSSHSPDDILEPVAHEWLQVIEKDADEQERLHALSNDVIRAYMKDELKDAKAVAEVVCLTPVLDKDSFHDLLREFYSGLQHSGLLNFQLLEGLAQLIQGADPGHLNSDDLVKILELLSARLRDTHQQSAHHMYQLTMAVSHVLDAMADTRVTGLDRKNLHEPLSNYLSGLMNSSDPFLVYQAAYAYQALICVPDNETTWQAAMRRTGKVIQGIAGLVSAVKGLDLEKFMDGLSNIQKGVEGVSKVIEVARTAYDGVSSLAKSGQGLVTSLKEGLSFERRREWYAALRGADTLIRDGELASFKKLVCEAPCRYDAAFQWGVCQRLGEMAANPTWDAVTRRSAITFLGEIYRGDDMWGQQASVKQWILNILMQLSSTKNSGPSATLQLHAIVARTLLEDLGACDDSKKLELYRACRTNGPVAYPLKIALPELGSPSLLDRVQNRPDVEGNIRVLRKQRTKERGNAVYIPPQAKPNSQSSDDTRFPLMERVKEFLQSDQRVFLLLGDSGAGKSTFSRELEFDLWQSYENKTGRIPLHINLPAIEKPEHDMIAKHLRKTEFTEPQIREMKHHRRFILICDGYDESQQTHNLYVTNKLNEPGEWDAQMVISCRSEYLGVDYRDRFQSGGDRNTRSDSMLFQEAVVAPFTMDQVQAYIQQYVAMHQPLWRIEDYKQALELIPSLKDLVKNPFLMTLSLDVLPRMMDPGQHLSATHVTRVALYDHFVEQWLERGKKRLGEKDMSRQTKAAFEKLSAEGFTLSGIEFLKGLAVAIYKEQGGNPVIEYSQLVDEDSWKSAFFEREHKQLLLEACPLTRNGNQRRFIHRSLLEYGLARAVFDPQSRKNRESPDTVVGRRGSTSSALSFEMLDISNKELCSMDQGPDPESPLVWRSFVNDQSLLHFLEERVQQEPLFKRQLFAYIEHSKLDKKWRTAAANAITILVRSGAQLNDMDFRGIQIPGADLSYGVFGFVQFQGADLRKVNLRGSCMIQADLSGAQMGGVQFGELPYLVQDWVVWSCVYSPDGTSFAVGLDNSKIVVYTTSNWEESVTLEGHGSSVYNIAYSPSGDQIASASQDCTVRLWDSKSGECRFIFILANAVLGVAYSPRGSQIAMGGDDRLLRLRDPKSGESIRVFSGHTNGVHRTAYSPCGDRIATAGGDLTVRVWIVDTGACTHIMIGHTAYIWSIAYSPRGDQIASTSNDTTLRLWDVESGHSCRVIKHPSTVNSVAYSPQGGQVASGSDDYTVRIWDVDSGANLQTFTGHGSYVLSVAYSPQGHHIASGSYDGTVRLWDNSAGISRFVSRGRSNVPRIACSTANDQFALYQNGNTIQLVDMGTGVCRRTLIGHRSFVRTVIFSPQGGRAVSYDDGGSVLLWNMESGSSHRIVIVEDYWGSYPSLAYSPDGNIFAYSDEVSRVQLCDSMTGECFVILVGHTDKVKSIALSPDGKMIASGSRDGTIRLWDIENCTCRHTLKCGSIIYGVTFSPQGNQLASVGSDDRVRVWNLDTGECLMILIGHNTHYLDITINYSLNGDTLISGSNTVIRLWDVVSGRCRAILPDVHGNVRDFIPRSTLEDILVVTSSDNGDAVWKIVDEGDRCRLSALWISATGALDVTGATMQDARGLSQLNKQLLKQRGAKGEPESLLMEKSKKLVAMSSVLSKLRQPMESTSEGQQTSSTIQLPKEQVESEVQQPDERQKG